MNLIPAESCRLHLISLRKSQLDTRLEAEGLRLLQCPFNNSYLPCRAIYRKDEPPSTALQGSHSAAPVSAGRKGPEPPSSAADPVYTDCADCCRSVCVFHCRLQRKFAAHYSGLVQLIANNNSLLTFAFAYAAITYL